MARDAANDSPAGDGAGCSDAICAAPRDGCACRSASAKLRHAAPGADAAPDFAVGATPGADGGGSKVGSVTCADMAHLQQAPGQQV